MGDTEISWTHRPGTRGRSWNPVQGCRRISPGCQHCYAERMAARFAKDGWSQGLININTGTWNGVARMALHKLADPMRWRDPSTVFVNSMSDLFYEGFTNEQIAAVFGVMAATPEHTYIVLTKRAKRMHDWFTWLDEQIEAKAVATSGADCAMSIHDARDMHRRGFLEDAARRDLSDVVVEKACMKIRKLERDYPPDGEIPDYWNAWPVPNIWLGVSTEDQDAADERIPWLLKTPATVRLISAEPLLGPIDLTLRGSRIDDWDEDWKYDTLAGWEWASPRSEPDPGSSPALDWVIVGCESGPGARECELRWVRSLRDQCLEAGVPVFVKQLVDTGSDTTNGVNAQGETIGVTCGTNSAPKGHGFGGPVIERPYLDNVQHLAFPEDKP